MQTDRTRATLLRLSVAAFALCLLCLWALSARAEEPARRGEVSETRVLSDTYGRRTIIEPAWTQRGALQRGLRAYGRLGLGLASLHYAPGLWSPVLASTLGGRKAVAPPDPWTVPDGRWNLTGAETVTGASDAVQLQVVAVAGQAANIVQVQQSGGAVVFHVKNNGAIGASTRFEDIGGGGMTFGDDGGADYFTIDFPGGATRGLEIPNTTNFAVRDGTNNLLTVTDAGTVGNVAVTGSLAVGGGTAVARVLLTTTASTDLGGAITATCTAETNFAIAGVAVGDSCDAQLPAAVAATDWVVCRTLVDNVALKYCTQGAAVDPASLVYRITTIEY